MKIKNVEQVRKVFENASSAVLPDVIREKNQSIRVATITRVNSTTKTAQIRFSATGETVNNIKYPKNFTDVLVGETCLVISADPRSKGQLFISAIY